MSLVVLSFVAIPVAVLWGCTKWVLEGFHEKEELASGKKKTKKRSKKKEEEGKRTRRIKKKRVRGRLSVMK